MKVGRITTDIEYKVNERISENQFVALLRASTLAVHRPVDDPERIRGIPGP
ncbi:MAG: hypothetical protein ACRESR_07465 [Gammaproteobacteria bacterium]